MISEQMATQIDSFTILFMLRFVVKDQWNC